MPRLDDVVRDRAPSTASVLRQTEPLEHPPARDTQTALAPSSGARRHSITMSALWRDYLVQHGGGTAAECDDPAVRGRDRVRSRLETTTPVSWARAGSVPASRRRAAPP